MAGALGRNFNLCFTKIRRPTSPQASPVPLYPDDQRHPSFSTATASSILIKNFNSLYDNNTVHDDSASSRSLTQSSSELESDSDFEPQPDFATVFASQRFFFASPGRSNSIIESSSSIREDTGSSPSSSSSSSASSSSNIHSDRNLTNGCDQSQCPTVKDSVAVPTYSPDPYADFRKSMQEMVEARELHDVKAHWDYLHELLLCYLALNPKSTHKFIIGAFADLLVSLMSSSSNQKQSTYKAAL